MPDKTLLNLTCPSPSPQKPHKLARRHRQRTSYVWHMHAHFVVTEPCQSPECRSLMDLQNATGSTACACSYYVRPSPHKYSRRACNATVGVGEAARGHWRRPGQAGHLRITLGQSAQQRPTRRRW